MMYAATTGLSFLIFSTNLIFPIAFAFLFGLYPILKSLMERMRSVALGYGLKAGYFTIVFLISVLLYKSFLSIDIQGILWIAVFLLCFLLFIVYDWCLTRIIFLYINKIARFL